MDQETTRGLGKKRSAVGADKPEGRGPRTGGEKPGSARAYSTPERERRSDTDEGIVSSEK